MTTYTVKMKYATFTHAELHVGKYQDGTLAVELYEDGDLERVSTNLGEYAHGFTPLKSDEFYVKNYSEHEGMVAALVEAGIAEDTGKQVAFGPFETSANVMRLVATDFHDHRGAA